jgi:hypothetical protein
MQRINQNLSYFQYVRTITLAIMIIARIDGQINQRQYWGLGESLLTSTAAGPETKKRSTDEDEDPLLDEISQTIEETEKTSPKIAPKLANTIQGRTLGGCGGGGGG